MSKKSMSHRYAVHNVELSRPFPSVARRSTLDIYQLTNQKLEAPIPFLSAKPIADHPLTRRRGNKRRGGRAHHRVILGGKNQTRDHSPKAKIHTPGATPTTNRKHGSMDVVLMGKLEEGEEEQGDGEARRVD